MGTYRSGVRKKAMTSLSDKTCTSPSTRADDTHRGSLADPVADRQRLEEVRRWLQTAKENLPDLNNGRIPADRIAALSGLVDRMHRVATAAAAEASQAGRRQRQAA
jgi:hypothetical protein